MWIRGFVHEDIDQAFMANVELVSKWVADHRAGINVGYMELSNGSNLEVFRHPAGTFYGYEVKEG